MTRRLGLVVLLIVVGALVFRGAARPAPPNRGFYYWKTEWTGSPELGKRLAQNRISRLYMRFFDVTWDDASNSPQPVAPLRLNGAVPDGVEVVPVVYLTNAVFLRIQYRDVETLADRVWTKVSGMAGTRGVAFQEVQLDCDWSDNSQRNYFHFVELLNRRLSAESKHVSTTLRLHQVKFKERTGVPPASRAMLMFYNFGRIEAESARSSIFNVEDASRYASYIRDYPLPLDAVLPAFSWSIHSREGRVLGLLEHVTDDDIRSFDGFRRVTENGYEASRSFFFRGRYFMSGDRVTIETTTPAITREAAVLAKQGAGSRKPYGLVALFDLDERRSASYSEADIESILSQF